MRRLAELVGDADWFAGVHVVEDGRVLLTVGGESPGIPGPLPPRAHVRWIGGGRLPGEGFAECARREAVEELGCEVELLHSPETIVELRPSAPAMQEMRARPAPLLVQRYDDGMFLVLYRALLLGKPHPTDVERLVWVPLPAIEPLAQGVDPVEAEALGLEVIGPAPRPGAMLFIGPAGAEYLLWRLGVDTPCP